MLWPCQIPLACSHPYLHWLGEWMVVMPLTDIRINSLDNTLTLTYLGVITQNTDEDWKDTRLVRSTGVVVVVKS